MILYKNNLPLLPQEEIAGHLGLVVPPEETKSFFKPQTLTKPPKYGWGTRAFMKEWSFNKFFAKARIPLEFEYLPADEISSANELIERLRSAEQDDRDVLVNYNWEHINTGKPGLQRHVILFDRVTDKGPRFVDTSIWNEKWPVISAEKLFEAIQRHNGVIGGIWYFNKKQP